MTLAHRLKVSERAYDVYRVLWGPRRGILSIPKAQEKYPIRGGKLSISLGEMRELLEQLEYAHFLLPLSDLTTKERKYERTDSGRRTWVRVHGS